VDGIALSCTDAEALRSAVNGAVKAGIPVVCWGADSPDSRRAAFVGTNDVAVGRVLGETLRKRMPKGGDVALLTGNVNAENMNNRIDGFRKAIKGSNLDILTVLPCNGDAAESAAIVRNYTKLHPNVKGWCILGEWPLLGRPPGAFSGAKPGDVKVVGFGTVAPALQYVRKGYVDALVEPKYYEWGQTSVKMLDLLARGKKAPSQVDSGLVVVTRDTAEVFARTR
jgi:ribose transport system substrate-binding protein